MCRAGSTPGQVARTLALCACVAELEKELVSRDQTVTELKQRVALRDQAIVILKEELVAVVTAYEQERVCIRAIPE